MKAVGFTWQGKCYYAEIVGDNIIRFHVDDAQNDVRIKPDYTWAWALQKTQIKAIDGAEGLLKRIHSWTDENFGTPYMSELFNRALDIRPAKL